MIVVRDIFRVKFGQSKQATDLWKEGIGINQRLGHGRNSTRLLTDVAGQPYYTLILESTFDSLAQWEQSGQAVRKDAAWRTWYQKLVPLIDTGHREILSVIE